MVQEQVWEGKAHLLPCGNLQYLGKLSITFQALLAAEFRDQGCIWNHPAISCNCEAASDVNIETFTTIAHCNKL